MPAGIEIVSLVLNELNYAPEIAASMLKKQAAGAMLEARTLIVAGAVQIATDAITQLEESSQITYVVDKVQGPCVKIGVRVLRAGLRVGLRAGLRVRVKVKAPPPTRNYQPHHTTHHPIQPHTGGQGQDCH